VGFPTVLLYEGHHVLATCGDVKMFSSPVGRSSGDMYRKQNIHILRREYSRPSVFWGEERGEIFIPSMIPLQNYLSTTIFRFGGWGESIKKPYSLSCRTARASVSNSQGLP
jgi:hypothetical protein